jgi:hypothetical protein
MDEDDRAPVTLSEIYHKFEASELIIKSVDTPPLVRSASTFRSLHRSNNHRLQLNALCCDLRGRCFERRVLTYRRLSNLRKKFRTVK